MRGAILPLSLLLTFSVASCASDSAAPAASGTVTGTEAPGGAESTGTTGTAPLRGPAGQLADQYGVRYCEVLTVTVADVGTTAEVWGTQGLNDCPQPAFAAIDPATVVADMGVTAALPNGPRFWVLDDIVANAMAGSGEIRSFGGIEMRSIAIVDLGRGIPDRTPYAEISVRRDTEFRFGAGRMVHELTGPDGSIFVMQSYSLEVDPMLDAGNLADLGRRLALPEGWTFASRVLDEPMVVEDFDGVATVIQDDLRNSYQLRTRGR